MKKWKTIACIMLVAFLVASVGCGLPGDLKKKAKAVPGQIDATAEEVKQIKKRFDDQAKSSGFKPFAVYARPEAENWNQHFVEAEAEIARANSVYTKDIKPFLDRNKKEEAAALQQQLDRVSTIRRSIIATAKKPATRLGDLQTAKKDAPKLIATAEKEQAQAQETYVGLSAFLQKAEVDFPASSYPSTAKSIAARIVVANKLNKDAREGLEKAKKQRSSSTPDYAVLTDGCALVTANLKKIKEHDKADRKEIKTAYGDYAKRLDDMREDYYVIISRSSWDKDSDCCTDDYKYPRPFKVTEDHYDAFADFAGDKLAVWKDPWRGDPVVQVYVNQMAWNSLGIAVKEGWDSKYHDTAEYYLADLQIKYYHRYTIVENGESKQGGWEQVSEPFYEKNKGNLMMDVIVKPYGTLQSETITAAAPPGMAYVGNKEYGKWNDGGTPNDKSDDYWDWYVKYRFYSMMWGGGYHHYHYNDWNDYNRNYRGSRPYYGSGGQKSYGTHGRHTAASPTAQKSTIGKSGGLRTQSTSVRGAGAAKRGGGPGGGGK